MGSVALWRGIRDVNPEEPVESDLVPRVTVAERDRTPGTSFLSVSSVAGISIWIGAIGVMSCNRKSYDPVPNAVPGRFSVSGLDGCVVVPLRGGNGDRGRDVIVSFRDRSVGGAVADLTVPSLKSCSKGCSVVALLVGRGVGGPDIEPRFPCPWEVLRKGRVWIVSVGEDGSTGRSKTEVGERNFSSVDKGITISENEVSKSQAMTSSWSRSGSFSSLLTALPLRLDIMMD